MALKASIGVLLGCQFGSASRLLSAAERGEEATVQQVRAETNVCQLRRHQAARGRSRLGASYASSAHGQRCFSAAPPLPFDQRGLLPILCPAEERA